MSINTKTHTVTCDFCGEAHTDFNKSTSELREELRQDGWSTSVPAWAFHSPAMRPADVLQKYPSLKRKTVDTCNICGTKKMEKVGRIMNGLETPEAGIPAELRFRFEIETGAIQ
jgi:hypothetical protein